MYQPRPLDTNDVILSPEVTELLEQLARNTHEVWAAERMKEGWTWGPVSSDERKEHPCLVPYEELPEAEKDYDRRTSEETLRVISLLGYQITKENQ